MVQLLDEYKAHEKDLKDDLVFTDWINHALVGKKVKFTTKTTNQGDAEKRYSTLDTIIKFLEFPNLPAKSWTGLEHAWEPRGSLLFSYFLIFLSYPELSRKA